MSAVFLDPFALPFMSRALLALIIVGVAGAAVSVFVLLRRLAFAADTITHTVFPGVVVGFLTAGEEGVLWGALAAAIVTAVALTLLSRASRVSDDAAMAILLTSMFSIGVVLISRRSSYTSDLTAFLFGRVLTVSAATVTQTAVVAAIALAGIAATAKEQVFRAFDPIGSSASGYRVTWLDLVLNSSIALVVVGAARAVGVLLVVALLVVPAAAGRLVSSRIWVIAATGVALTVAAAYGGLLISYHAAVDYGARLAPGPAVVLTLVAAYVLIAASTAMTRRARSGAVAARPEVRSGLA